MRGVWSQFRSSRPAMGGLLAALVALVVYPLLPRGSAEQSSLYSLFGLVVVAVILANSRGAERRLWRLFGLGLALVVSGDLIWCGYAWVGLEPPYPSSADLVYLLGYLVMAFTVFRLRRPRGRSERDLPSLIDALILTVTFSFLFWTAAIEPALEGSPGVGWAGRTVSVLYPAFDVLMVYGVARLRLLSQRRAPSLSLLGAGLSLLLLSDLVYTSQMASGSYQSGELLDLGWLVAYLCFAGAAFLSNREAQPAASDEPPDVSGWPRALTLGLALVVGCAGALADRLREGRLTVWELVLLVLVVPLLVLARLSLLLRSYRLLSRRLAASQERLQQSFASAAIGMALCDRQGRLLDANPALGRFLGYEQRELVGLSFADVTHVDDRDVDRTEFQRLLAGEIDSYTLEKRYLRKDGRVVWGSLSTSLALDEQGRFLYALGQVEDVNERKEAELALEESRERYRTIVETAVEGVWLVDAQGRTTFVNDSFAAMLGHRAEELVGVDADQIMLPEGRDEMAARGPSWRGELETRLRRQGGEAVYVRMAAGPVFDALGQVSGRLAMVMDMTEQRRSRQALAASERRHRTLVQAAAEGIWSVDADWRITFANPAMLRLLGYDHYGEIAGRPLKQFLPQSEWSDIDRQPALFETGQAFEREGHYIRRDGSLANVRLLATPLYDEQGELNGAMALVTDLSESKRLEEELGRAQKLEGIGKLAGGVAHDFNNLLTAISGYAEFARLRAAELEDVELVEEIDEILASSRRAAELTKQLLAFSRRQALQPQALYLRDVIGDMLRMLGRVIGEDVEIVTEFVSEPLQVLADPTQLEQVIVNLAVNARDAMPQGGQLKIVIEPALDVSFDGSSGDYALLRVSDSGCGMSRETLSRVFEPFFTTKELGHGTGLGLSTVYGIVAQSGGHILVDSELGVGTTFSVYLPLAVAGQTAPQPRMPRLEPRHPRVLLVEDDGAGRQVAGEMLRQLGYEAVATASPREAIARLSADPDFCLVLSDLVMPQMTGIEMVARMRDFQPSLKVLYMSGFARAATAQVAAADERLLDKPFSLQQLAEALESALAPAEGYALTTASR